MVVQQIRDYLERTCLTNPVDVLWAKVISDEQPLIEQTLKQLCDEEGCCLVVTTGGTGPAARDVTPEATEAVSEKLMHGFGELMRKVSLGKSSDSNFIPPDGWDPKAIFDRQSTR